MKKIANFAVDSCFFVLLFFLDILDRISEKLNPPPKEADDGRE